MCIQWILRKGANKARRDEAAKVATSPMGALNLTTRSMSNPDHASSPETNPCWLTRYQVLVPSLLCPPSSTRHICFFFRSSFLFVYTYMYYFLRIPFLCCIMILYPCSFEQSSSKYCLCLRVLFLLICLFVIISLLDFALVYFIRFSSYSLCFFSISCGYDIFLLFSSQTYQL